MPRIWVSRCINVWFPFCSNYKTGECNWEQTGSKASEWPKGQSCHKGSCGVSTRSGEGQTLRVGAPSVPQPHRCTFTPCASLRNSRNLNTDLILFFCLVCCPCFISSNLKSKGFLTLIPPVFFPEAPNCRFFLPTLSAEGFSGTARAPGASAFWFVP